MGLRAPERLLRGAEAGLGTASLSSAGLSEHSALGLHNHPVSWGFIFTDEELEAPYTFSNLPKIK